uniref:Uncharacterized protein n=1 Tax=Anguilla anguilla TaxID=7936 RepID=A0A0E9TZ31_ANGAN
MSTWALFELICVLVLYNV